MKKTKKVEEKLAIKRFRPSVDKGLSSLQVQQRIDEKLTNNAEIKSSKTYYSIFCKNIFTFFNFLWLIIAVGLIVVGAYNDLLFLLVIFLNTIIAIIQEMRAKITVEKLSIATEPTVTTIRNGEEIEISSKELVLDDIIVLENGNQIPSDCIIVQGQIEVNESLLTGESKPVKKTIKDTLLSGSFLVSGKCYAKIEKVGKENYIQQLSLKAKSFKAPSSSLFKDLNKLIKYISIALVPLGVLTFVKEWFKANNIFESVTQTSAAVIGMIPAGMFLLITVALSVGVIKLAKKKTLVKDIYSIEMLARVNTLCLDKTGTITDGTMNVVEMINFSQTQTKSVEKILSNILASQSSGNLTSIAMIKKFGKTQDYIPSQVVEFSSERKFSVTTFKGKGTYFLGAPTFTNCPLTKEQKDVLDLKMNQGYRVLALAKSEKKYDENKPAKAEKLLCFIIIEDHIREDAIDTIAWFKENGVDIKIISGDDPLTVSKIAQRVGVSNFDKTLSLEGMSLEEVEKQADKFTVFGRVSPEQKYVLVKTLKKQGKVVAMTGDGINDTLALKEADCSIAMADGSEVARNISNLVLLDSKFSSLPSVVKEGRQVINNVQSASVLFLMKTLFTILLCFFTLVLNQSYPFSPSGLFMMEMFVIGLPSFIMTFEPNSKLIKGNFIPQVLKNSLPRTILMLAFILITIFLAPIVGLTNLENETLSILMLTGIGLINLTWLCYPFNKFKVGIPFLAIALCAFGVCFLNKIFGIATLAQMELFRTEFWLILLICLTLALIVPIIVEIFKHFIAKKQKQKKVLEKYHKELI